MIMGKTKRNIVTRNMIYLTESDEDILPKRRQDLLAGVILQNYRYVLYFAGIQPHAQVSVLESEFYTVVMLPEMIQANRKNMRGKEFPVWINKRQAVSAEKDEGHPGFVRIAFRNKTDIRVPLSEVPKFLNTRG